jgi:hypothetical protein
MDQPSNKRDMKKEKLIEELQKLPDGIEVVVFDWRKNLSEDDGDGSGAGIYPEFDVEFHQLEPDEAEYFKERNDKDFVPFISLGFKSDDYDDDGRCLKKED